MRWHYDPLAHVLSPLAFFWSDADVLSRTLGLSFELGPVHFILAVVGAWCGRNEPFILAASAIYVALLLLMTRALAFFWLLYPFSMMQFPWRLLAVSAVFQLICMLGLARLDRGADRKDVVMAVALVVVTGVWHSDVWVFKPMPENILASDGARRVIAASFPPGSTFVPFDVARPSARDVRIAAVNARYAVPLSPLATFDAREWTPITALTSPLRRPRSEFFLEPLSGLASVVPMEGSSKFRLDYAIDAATPCAILINQLYLPGWRVSLNGTAVPEAVLRDNVLADGRIAVRMGPGKHRLQAWYDGPPGWRWKLLATLATAGVFIVWLFRNPRARNEHP